jgi:hypothetical protein
MISIHGYVIREDTKTKISHPRESIESTITYIIQPKNNKNNINGINNNIEGLVGTLAGAGSAIPLSGPLAATHTSLVPLSAYTNFFAPNVVFVYINLANGAYTIESRVHNVSAALLTGAFALVESRRIPGHDGPVNLVTAVYIPSDRLTVEHGAVAYYHGTRAVGTATPQVGGTSYHEYAVHVATQRRVLPVHMFGANTPVPDGSATLRGFYTMARRTDGSYQLTLIPDEDPTVRGLTTQAAQFPISSGFMLVGSGAITIFTTNAEVVDLRTPGPGVPQIPANVEGLFNFARTENNTIQVSVLYNPTTSEASVIYLTDAVVIPIP